MKPYLRHFHKFVLTALLLLNGSIGNALAQTQSTDLEDSELPEWFDSFSLKEAQSDDDNDYSDRRTMTQTKVWAIPNQQSKTISILEANTALKAQSVPANGKPSHFAKIKWTVANKPAEGYVLLKNLGVSPPEKDGLTLIYHIKDETADSIEKPTHIEVFLFKNHQQVAITHYLFEGYGNSDFTYASISDNESLTFAKNIIRISHSGEACGIPTIGKTWAWDGTQLIRLPDTENISDAGVFYHSESLAFITDHDTGEQKIVKLIADDEVTEESSQSDEPEYKSTRAHIEYPWVGKDIIEPEEKP